MNLNQKDIIKLVDATIACFVANFRLEELKGTPLYKQGLKNSVNRALEHLKQAEETYDIFENATEENAVSVHDNYYHFLEVVSKVPISQVDEARAVLDAYLKSPDSMLGIAKKVLH